MTPVLASESWSIPAVSELTALGHGEHIGAFECSLLYLIRGMSMCFGPSMKEQAAKLTRIFIPLVF
jgi:hypothetical protein